MGKAKVANIEIPALDLETLTIRLIGNTPLIVHRFADKARKQILDKQQGVAKKAGKDKREPQQDYVDGLYYFPADEPKNGTARDPNKIPKRTGFPVTAFKNACAEVAKEIPDLAATTVRKSFHIKAAKGSFDLVEIEGTPHMVEHTVKIGMGTTDLRFRPQYDEWAVTLDIVKNGILTSAQVVNLFEQSGFSVGVGEWRPQRNGMNGQYSVQKTAR